MNTPLTSTKKKRQLKLHQRIAAAYSTLSFWNKLALLFVILALPLGYGALLVLKPVYKSWRADNALQIAGTAVESGDMKAASLAFRTAIRSRPRDPEVWRRVGAFLDQAESPESVVVWERVRRLDPDDLDARYRLFDAALRSQRLEKAAVVLEEVPEADRAGQRYLRAAASLAIASNDPASATQHLEGLLDLDPTNEEATWDLTRVQLLAPDQSIRVAARDKLKAYAEEGGERSSEARRQLVRLALAESDFYTANRVAMDLVSGEETTPQDEILFLDTEFASQSFTLPNSIAQILEYVEANPPAAPVVVGYLTARGMSARLETWFEGLPAELRADASIQTARFDLALHIGDWPRVFSIIRAPDSPYSFSPKLADEAEEALADHRRGSLDAFPKWQRAVFVADGNLEATYLLATMARSLGWTQAENLALWNLASLVGDRIEIWSMLLRSELADQNSPGILRALSGAVRADPDNRSLRNDWILMNALLEQGRPEDLLDLAEENALHAPKNPFFATTFALVLARAGEVDRAKEVIRAIDESERLRPERALYVGMILAQAGDLTEAQTYLDLASQAQDSFLPAEATLLKNARDLASGQLSREEQLELLTASGSMTEEEQAQFTETLRAQIEERGDGADSEAVIQGLRDSSESNQRSPEEIQRILDGLREVSAGSPTDDKDLE